jgi:hypothetical protein
MYPPFQWNELPVFNYTKKSFLIFGEFLRVIYICITGIRDK